MEVFDSNEEYEIVVVDVRRSCSGLNGAALELMICSWLVID